MRKIEGEELGVQIREQRERAGMVQRELAVLLGVSQKSVSRMELGGPVTVSPDVFDKLALFLVDQHDVKPTRRVVIVGGHRGVVDGSFSERLREHGVEVGGWIETFAASGGSFPSWADGAIIMRSSPHSLVEKAKSVAKSAGIPFAVVDHRWTKAEKFLRHEGFLPKLVEASIVPEAEERYTASDGTRPTTGWLTASDAAEWELPGVSWDDMKGALPPPTLFRESGDKGNDAAIVQCWRERDVKRVRDELLHLSEEPEVQKIESVVTFPAEPQEQPFSTSFQHVFGAQGWGEPEPLVWSSTRGWTRARGVSMPAPHSEDSADTGPLAAAYADMSDAIARWADLRSGVADRQELARLREQVDLLKTHVGVLELELADEKDKLAVERADNLNLARDLREQEIAQQAWDEHRMQLTNIAQVATRERAETYDQLQAVEKELEAHRARAATLKALLGGL